MRVERDAESHDCQCAQSVGLAVKKHSLPVSLTYFFGCGVGFVYLLVFSLSLFFFCGEEAHGPCKKLNERKVERGENSYYYE